MDADVREKAQQTMAGLLQALGIKRVISIDDFNSPNLEEELRLNDVTDVTGLLLADDAFLEPVVQILQNLDRELGFDAVDPAEAEQIAGYLTESWAVLPPSKKLAIVQATVLQREGRKSIAEDELADDVSAPELLREFLQGMSDFRRYSLSEWRRKSAGELRNTAPVLILVDRNFEREEAAGGTSDLGEQLLGDILEASKAHVHAGLLTRNASDGNSERDLTNTLRARFANNADRVLAIGKFRLKEPAEFPAAVRTLLLVREIREYRQLARTALTEAHAEVLAGFEQLEDHTLIGAVSVAQREGTYELEHPLRLSQRQYHELIIRAVRSEKAQALLPRLRQGAVAKYLTADKPGEQIRALQHADTFEPAHAVNSLGLPLEVGDIFERSWKPQGSIGDREASDTAYFVLLAQACDLSIRRNGDRPNVVDLVLHPVEIYDDDEFEQKPNKRNLYHRLGDLHQDGRVWGVRYTGSIVVPTEALDATVFRPDGQAILTVRKPDTRPHSEGWEQRQKVLQKFARTAVQKFADAEKHLGALPDVNEHLSRLSASYALGSTAEKRGVSVRIDSTAGTLEYGLRRIARIRSDVAVNVAALASRYATRPAFELESVPSA